MKERRIAHISDLHIDANPDVALRCYEHALAVALESDVDALVIAGDVWHRGIYADDRSPLVRMLRVTRDFSAHAPVVIIKGNSHDMPGSLDVFREIADGTHEIHVFTSPGMVYAGGIAFACLPYPDKAHLMRWAESSDQDETDRTAEDAIRQICGGLAAQFAATVGGGFRPFPDDSPRVLVFHGNVRGCTIESGQSLLGGDVLVGADDLEASTADYIAMGHIHTRQQMGSKCHYSGSLHHVSHGERGPRVMLIADVWRGGYEIVDEVTLPSRAKITVDFSGDEWKQIDTEELRGADVKLRVRLTPEEASTWDDAPIVNDVSVYANSVTVERVIVRGERVARAESITTTHSLRGKVEAWGGATGTGIPTGTLEKADRVEGGNI